MKKSEPRLCVYEVGILSYTFEDFIQLMHRITKISVKLFFNVSRAVLQTFHIYTYEI